LQTNSKTFQPIFRKFGGKEAHQPRKNLLDFGSNDYVSIDIPHHTQQDCYTQAGVSHTLRSWVCLLDIFKIVIKSDCWALT